MERDVIRSNILPNILVELTCKSHTSNKLQNHAYLYWEKSNYSDFGQLENMQGVCNSEEIFMLHVKQMPL